jgi:hypothetical protein
MSDTFYSTVLIIECIVSVVVIVYIIVLFREYLNDRDDHS